MRIKNSAGSDRFRRRGVAPLFPVPYLIYPINFAQVLNSEFVNIGKGGLPQNPEYTLAEDIIKIGLVAPVIASEKTKKPAKKRKERIEVKPKKTRKPPAQGWIFHENGMVELVAYNPDRLEEQRTWNNHKGCQ